MSTESVPLQTVIRPTSPNAWKLNIVVTSSMKFRKIGKNKNDCKCNKGPNHVQLSKVFWGIESVLAINKKRKLPIHFQFFIQYQNTLLKCT